MNTNNPNMYVENVCNSAHLIGNWNLKDEEKVMEIRREYAKGQWLILILMWVGHLTENI